MAFIAVFLFATTVSYGQTTGHSNVRISDAVTVNGEWSGSNSEGWVFSPTADNANVQTTDLEAKIRYGTVSITTVNSSGTQLGSIYLDDDVSQFNSDTSFQNTLHLDAQGIIEVNDYILMDNYNQYSTNHIRLEAVGDIVIRANVSTQGDDIYYSNSASNNASSGDIHIISGSKVSIAASITASGVNNTYLYYASTYGYAFDSGSIYIEGVGGVSIGGNLSAIGGDATYRSSYDGSPNNIEINTGYGSLTTDGTNDGQTSGVISGLNFTKSGSGVLQLTGSNMWTGYTDVSSGALMMGSSGSIPSSKNLEVEGVLDLKGQNYTTSTFNGSGRVTSSVLGDATLSVSNSGTFSGLLEDGSGRLSIVKSNSTIFSLTGSNTYSGLTRVRSNGRLLISNSSALGATVSGTVVENGASLQLVGGIAVGDESLSLTGNGVSNQGALYNVSGSNTWSGTLDLAGNTTIEVDSGSELSLLGSSSITSSSNGYLRLRTRGDMLIGGVIAMGSGYLQKYDDGMLTLKGNNTYTGITDITNGIVKITHDNALGDVSGTTTVSSGASLVLEGGIAVGAEPITIAGTGHDSDTGALTSISGNNSYGGAITMNTAVIKTVSDTLTLDGSTAVSASSGKILTVEGPGDLVLSGVYDSSNSKIVLDSGSHLRMGASDVLSSSIDLDFNGGGFYTQGYNNELDELILTEDSELYLGTGSHTLRFTEAGTFNFRKLTINDWSGTYGGSGVSGSAGKVFVTADLNREKLDQIDYYNSDDSKDYYTLQLDSQELVPGNDRLGTPTGHSNVRISDAVTVNGEWSGSNSEGWVFSPTADNANVQTTDLEAKIRYGTVSITTVNSSGTQLGSIYLDDDVSQFNSDTSFQNTLHLDAQGIIEVNDYILMDNYNQYSTNHIRLEAVGDIVIRANVSTQGDDIYYSNSASNNASSGDIHIISGSKVSIAASITASGVNNTYLYYASTYGYAFDSGSIYIEGVGGVSIGGNLSAIGGDSTYSSTRDGSSNSLEINTGYGSLTTDGTNDGQTSGVISGLNFTKSGSGVLQLTGSNMWTGYTDVSSGALMMGSSGSIPSSKNLLLSGGTLESFSASKSYGSLSFTANSSIELASGNHTLTFSSRGSFGNAALTIKGWVGTYGGSGMSGTEGKLKINTTLSASELAKIKFYNSVDGLYYAALQLSTKEIVPGAVIP